MRVKCKLTLYIHEKKPDIEKFSNQTEWLENTLVEVDKQSDTSHILQTPAQEDRGMKRNREEWSYIAETTTETKFKLIYNKKPKINPASKEKETVEVIDTKIPEKKYCTSYSN